MDGQPPAPTAGSTAETLAAYLAAQVARLEEQHRLFRRGYPEAVHQLRVAARRLRSVLATYSPVLVPGVTTGPRAELRWFAAELAEARDAQVLIEGLTTRIRDLPAGLVRGPVPDRVEAELGGRLRAGRARAESVLDGERHARLLVNLRSFLDRPPLTELAARPAREVVPGLLATDLARVRTRHEAYDAAQPGPLRDAALHDLRKAAKRLRYAAETARPVLGTEARRLAARAAEVQQLLGEHQDTVVARAALREIGAHAVLAGEDPFTYEHLHTLEEVRATELERACPGRLASILEPGLTPSVPARRPTSLRTSVTPPPPGPR